MATAVVFESCYDPRSDEVEAVDAHLVALARSGAPLRRALARVAGELVRRGHRVMVQIQSTWFPLVNLNPQRFLNIHEAKESDFQKATQRVYRSKGRASRLNVRVLPALGEQEPRSSAIPRIGPDQLLGGR